MASAGNLPFSLRAVLWFDAFTGLQAVPLALASRPLSRTLGLPADYLATKFGLFGAYGIALALHLRASEVPSRAAGWAAAAFNVVVTLESAWALWTGRFPGATQLGSSLFWSQVLLGPVLIAAQVWAAADEARKGKGE